MATPNPVNVEQVGRVMATLDDVRLILYVLIVVIILLCGFVGWMMKQTNAAREAEREDIREKEARIWAVADKFTDAAGKLAVELNTIRAEAARLEARADVPGPGRQ